MKNIEAILKDAGIELTEDQAKSINAGVTENYRTRADYDKQVEKGKSFETQYNSVKESLAKFDGVDVDQLKQQIKDANDKAAAAEKKAADELAARDYSDAVKAQAASLKFSSKSAERAFVSDLTAKKLQLQDGKLLGFDDFVKSYKEQDAGAFIDEQQENKPKFTDPMGQDKSGFHNTADEKLQKSIFRAMGIAEPEKKEE